MLFAAEFAVHSYALMEGASGRLGLDKLNDAERKELETAVHGLTTALALRCFAGGMFLMRSR